MNRGVRLRDEHGTAAVVTSPARAAVIARFLRVAVERAWRGDGGARLPAELAEHLDDLDAAARQFRERQAGDREGRAVSGTGSPPAVAHVMISVDEAALRAGLSPRRVRQLAEDGRHFIANRLGRTWAIDQHSLTEWIAIRDEHDRTTGHRDPH